MSLVVPAGLSQGNGTSDMGRVWLVLCDSSHVEPKSSPKQAKRPSRTETEHSLFPKRSSRSACAQCDAHASVELYHGTAHDVPTPLLLPPPPPLLLPPPRVAIERRQLFKALAYLLINKI